MGSKFRRIYFSLFWSKDENVVTEDEFFAFPLLDAGAEETEILMSPLTIDYVMEQPQNWI